MDRKKREKELEENISQDENRKETKVATSTILAEIISETQIKLQELNEVFNVMEGEYNSTNILGSEINQLVSNSVNPMRMNKEVQVDEVDLDWGVKHISQATAVFPQFTDDAVFGKVTNMCDVNCVDSPIFEVACSKRVDNLFSSGRDGLDTLNSLSKLDDEKKTETINKKTSIIPKNAKTDAIIKLEGEGIGQAGPVAAVLGIDTSRRGSRADIGGSALEKVVDVLVMNHGKVFL